MAGYIYYNRLALGCHFNGTNGSTTIIDDRGLNTITSNGSAQLSTAQKKFGTASCLLNGTTSYLSIPDSSLLNFSGDFTIEFFAYFNTIPSPGVYQAIVDKGWNNTTSVYSYWLGITNSGGTQQLIFTTSENGTTPTIKFQVNSGITATTWTHISMQRSGGTLQAFVNGTSIGTAAYSLTPYTGNGQVLIGCDKNGTSGAANSFLNAYIDDFIIINGIAAHKGNFTPPSAQYDDSQQAVNVIKTLRPSKSNQVPFIQLEI